MAKLVKKNKKKSINAPDNITSNIPYVSVYEEEGMFETSQGVFTKTYLIEDIDEKNVKNYNPKVVENAFAKLLNGLPDGMSMQFTIHNKLVQQETFLKKIVQVPDKEEKVNNWINEYNKTVADNSTIGHNNVKKNKYFTISVNADTAEDAAEMFKNVDQKIRAMFSNICEISVGGLSAVSRMKVLYSMFNPKSNDFGKNADLRGDGNFNLADMKKLALTTKDVVAPQDLKIEKNYMVLNGDTYVRSLFITSLPTNISQNLFSDITNVSSNMIFSVIYEPMDSEYGFDAVAKKVKENTVVKQSLKRDTIADRRKKTVVKDEILINENEQSYFEKAALKTIQSAVALQEKMMLCSFVIVLYADNLEILDRDTKLLHLSTSKFACQVKALDLQQIKGLQSALPLCYPSVDVKRAFTISKLSAVSPLNIHEVLQRNGLFCGLNAINDNLILLNRKNNPNLAGIIAGTEHSGKTFQNKREIFNALMSTKDVINVVSDTDEYDEFVKELGGEIIEFPFATNIFAMMNHYGLDDPDMYFKSIVLEAYLESLVRSKEKLINLNQSVLINEDMEESVDEIGNEVQMLCETDLNFNNAGAVLKYISENASKFPLFVSKFDEIKSHLTENPYKVDYDGENRFFLYKVKNLTDKIRVMDLLWNRQIDLKMKNKTSWIFVDSVDDLLSSEQSSAFVNTYIKKTNNLQNVLTMVIQNSVKLFTDSATSYRLEEMISSLGYYKLLNQGAIERKRYSDILNIPNTLTNYITTVGIGKGIILTPASNLAFDDAFYEEDPDNKQSENGNGAFYKLFVM